MPTREQLEKAIAAQEILALVHTLLKERAANIPDEETRHFFLENIPWHREIVRYYSELKRGEFPTEES